MTLKFHPLYGLCAIALLVSGCLEGHWLPGTREGLSLDGGSDATVGEADSGADAEISDAGPPPPPPECEVALCAGASSFLGDMPACCTTLEKCGLDFSALGITECLERDAPGQLTGACPAADVFGLVSFPGCCTPAGMCGLDADEFFPLGCIVGGIPIPGFPAEPAQACATTVPVD
jgi:hypothetical protein